MGLKASDRPKAAIGALRSAIMSACALACGCGVMVQGIQSGRMFPYDNVPLVKRGMHENEVLGLLGPPYGVGVSKDGNAVYTYEWTDSRINSFYGGVGIVGENKRIDLSGAEMEIEFGPASRLVNGFGYRITGPHNYDRLRRGTRE